MQESEYRLYADFAKSLIISIKFTFHQSEYGEGAVIETTPSRIRGTPVAFRLCKKDGHKDIGTCQTHLVYKRIGSLARSNDVVNQHHRFPCKAAFVYLHKSVCCKFVNVTDMDFPTLPNYLNVVETVLTAQPLTHHRGKLLVTPVVGTLATGRYAHKDSPGHLHRRQSISYLPCCPPNGIVPAILEVKNPPVRFHILKRCPFQVSLRNVVIECKLNHIAGFKKREHLEDALLRYNLPFSL